MVLFFTTVFNNLPIILDCDARDTTECLAAVPGLLPPVGFFAGTKKDIIIIIISHVYIIILVLLSQLIFNILTVVNIILYL